jgi:epoxyqueuosine reductase
MGCDPFFARQGKSTPVSLRTVLKPGDIGAIVQLHGTLYARECGFELAGVALAVPSPDFERYQSWIDAGYAGEMRYLTDRRAEVRRAPRSLLPSARSVICVGRLYNSPRPYSTEYTELELAWISRYAWGEDYHETLRGGLERIDAALRARGSGAYESKICVDTAPLLERSYARMAGLGWIGRNTCLIHEGAGSWFLLGELLTSLELDPDAPPADRCGTCRRYIDACPTNAIVPAPGGGTFTVDSRLCISYFTIELRGPIPEPLRERAGANVFGCDICQDVCPWNSKAPITNDPSFLPRHEAPPLARLAGLREEEFRRLFAGTPVTRARYSGFLRSVAVAMGNRGLPEFHAPLERLAASEDAVVAEHARWALARLRR